MLLELTNAKATTKCEKVRLKQGRYQPWIIRTGKSLVISWNYGALFPFLFLQRRRCTRAKKQATKYLAKHCYLRYKWSKKYSIQFYARNALKLLSWVMDSLLSIISGLMCVPKRAVEGRNSKKNYNQYFINTNKVTHK